ALDAADAGKVAALWERRLSRSEPSEHSAAVRLAGAIVVGDADGELRRTLLQSIVDGGEAEEATVARARDELALAAGEAVDRPTATAARGEGAVAIDGKLDDAAWASAEAIVFDRGRPGEQYEAKLLWD